MSDDQESRELRAVFDREAERLLRGRPRPEAPWHAPTPLAPRRDQARWRRLAPLAAAAAVVAVGVGAGIGLRARPAERAPMAEASSPSAEATSTAPSPPVEGGTEAPRAKRPAASVAPSPSDEAGVSADTRSAQEATTPQPTVAATAAVAAYWVGGPAGRRGLYREFRQGSPGPGPAVAAMLAGRPADPDLSSVWRPARVRSASVTGTGVRQVVDVDVSAAAFAATGVDEESARLAVQQLVYTATAAVPGSTTVRLRVDGRSGYRAWGRGPLPDLIRRDAAARASIWIIDPQQGDVRSGRDLTLRGSGWAFEGTVHWEVAALDGSGAAPRRGIVTTRGDGVPADFAVALTLPPGRYRVLAYEEDMSDTSTGPARRINVDSKDFTVR
ncbi:MAG: Gmad2 immunoglobulin-like domain-containing protein [Kineosporiaceae bacterium]